MIIRRENFPWNRIHTLSTRIKLENFLNVLSHAHAFYYTIRFIDNTLLPLLLPQPPLLQTQMNENWMKSFRVFCNYVKFYSFSHSFAALTICHRAYDFEWIIFFFFFSYQTICCSRRSFQHCWCHFLVEINNKKQQRESKKKKKMKRDWKLKHILCVWHFLKIQIILILPHKNALSSCQIVSPT